ncbi:hypothetical protein Tco_0206145 [Tanacetum coccineum]
MNDPNITMEEYIRLEEEKAQSRGETFNWQTATFGRIRHYYEEERFTNFKESSRPSISLDESEDEDYTIIFDENSFSYKIMFVNDLKTDSEDGNGNMLTSPKPTVDYFDDLYYFKDFENGFPAIVYNNSLTSKLDLGTKPLVISKCINESNLIDETSLSEYDEEIVSRFNNLFNDIHHDDLKSKKDDEDDDISIIQSLEDNEISHGENSYNGMLLFLIINLYVTYDIPFDPKRYYKDGSHTNVAKAKLGGARRRMTWIQFILALGLHTEQEMAEAGFGAYWAGSHAPSYVLIRDPVSRLCHSMMAYSISGRGQAPEKVTGVDLFYLRSMDRETTNVPHLLAQYLFRHTEWRKNGAMLSGGYFIGRLAMHFGLLERLSIYTRYGDTWAWVAQGPEKQQAATAGAHEADEARPAAEEVALEIPVPALAQAPPPPPPAPHPCTMSQRIERLEEEVHDLRRDVVGLQGDVASFTTEQSKVSTWLISCMTQLMDASGQTYHPFDNTLVGSSRLSFRRCVRPRTGEASTSTAHHTDAQPDP